MTRTFFLYVRDPAGTLGRALAFQIVGTFVNQFFPGVKFCQIRGDDDEEQQRVQFDMQMGTLKHLENQNEESGPRIVKMELVKSWHQISLFAKQISLVMYDRGCQEEPRREKQVSNHRHMCMFGSTKSDCDP